MPAIAQTAAPLLKQSASDSHPLDVYVIFTEAETTRRTLQAVHRLTQGLTVRLSVIVPQVIPYPLPLDEPAVPLPFTREALLEILKPEETETRVSIFLCRDRMEGIRAAVTAGSLLIVGATTRRWWNSAARLSRNLEQNGYRVILIETSANYGIADSHT